MRVTVRKNKMYFDEKAWALIKRAAKKTHQTPKTTVIRALRNGIKLAKKKEVCNGTCCS